MKVKLGDICKIYSGGDKPKVVSPKKTEECKIPIYGNSVDEEGLYGYTNFSAIDEKAVTISARGSNCGTAFFRNEPYVPIVRLLSLVPCDKLIVPEYLYYVIKNRPFKRTGSGQPQITIPQVSDCEVEIEENISIQKRIAKVLFDIDSKIKNNNAINAELEAMARTIYDYWFLQFDFPDENGKPYKSSGGKMVWNEELKREIPEGWEDGIFADFFEIGNGRDHKHLLDGTIPVYGSGGIMRYVNEALYNGESVLIPRKGTLNNIFYIKDAFWTVDTMYFTKMKKDNTTIFMYYTVKQYDFEKMNTGTGVPSMTSSIIYNLKTVIPQLDILRQFDNKVQSIYDMIKQNEKQNKELVSLRDFLLPLLMNGQVGFKEY